MQVIEEYLHEHPEDLARAWAESAPLGSLDIEVRLDWRCNAECKFCGVWKYSRDGMLSPERWMAIFDELATKGLRRVLFTGGEPMMVPYFHDVIEHVDSLGIETAIITNGSLLKAPRVARLAAMRHLRDVTISLDSGDAGVHDGVRKFQGLFKLAVDGMARLRTMAPQIRLTVNTVISAETAGSLRDLLSLPVLPDQLRVFPVGLDMRWLDTLAVKHEGGWAAWAAEAKDQELSGGERQNALATLSELQCEATAKGVTLEFDRMTPADDFSGNCYVPLGHFVVQPDGDVYPCCHMQSPEQRIGRLGAQSADDFFAGSEYRNFLAELRPVSLSACARCSRYRRFNEFADGILGARS
jgi:radical SAM protein with 4Fe4S-binding SPASM domain